MYNTKLKPPRISQSVSQPAPTGGVNDIDPISSMEEQFMIDSMNFFMDTGMPVARPGYREWAINFEAPIKTIMYFHDRDGTYANFASTDAGIYDITSGTDAPSIDHPLTDGLLGFTNFANIANNYLICCNGVDPTAFYDGTVWTNFTEVVTPVDPGEINGISPSLLIFPLSYKHRLWFIEKFTMTAWFLPLDQIGGVAEPFYLGGIFTKGGHLVALARWSSDTGEGLDDRLVFITSAGEIASYNGQDPTDADNWNLDSIFYVAAPVSARSVTDYGGDVLYLTRRGLVPLSSLISGSSTEILYSGALTRKISRTLMKLTTDPAPAFPGEVTTHNDSAWVIINLFDSSLSSTAAYDQVLSPGNNQPIQLVMNFLTGAWGKFNFPVRTMRSIDRQFFMGTEDGRVLVVTSDVYLDDVKFDGTGGQSIELYAFGAYTYLGLPTANKHCKFVCPTMQSGVSPAYKMRVLSDFRLNTYGASPSSGVVAGGSLWDVALWDQSLWARSSNVFSPWVSANVLGYSFAWQLKVSTSTAFGLASVKWVWETGGFV